MALNATEYANKYIDGDGLEKVWDLIKQKFAEKNHIHGNITSGGTITATAVAVANGDSIVVTDSSASGKVVKSTVSFDGTSTDKYLSQKGSWETIPTVNDGKLYVELNNSGLKGEMFSANSSTDSTLKITGAPYDEFYGEDGDEETPEGLKYDSRGTILFGDYPIKVKGLGENAFFQKPLMDIGDELGEDASENFAIMKRYISEKREMNFKGKTFNIAFSEDVPVDYTLTMRNGGFNTTGSGGFTPISGFSLDIDSMVITKKSGSLLLFYSNDIDFTIDHIKITNSKFFDVTRVLRLVCKGTAWQTPTMGIGTIMVSDCLFYWGTLTVNNGIKIVDLPALAAFNFINNKFYNCSVGIESTHGNDANYPGKAAMLSERACPYIIKGNYFDCGVFVCTSSSNMTYHASCVIENGVIHFEDNTIERCVTINETSEEATAYDAYLTANEVYGNNNKVKNIAGWTRNGGTFSPYVEVFKSKGTPDRTKKAIRKYTNYVITIDTDYLASLGLDVNDANKNRLGIMTMNQNHYSMDELYLENNILDCRNTYCGMYYNCFSNYIIRNNQFIFKGVERPGYGLFNIDYADSNDTGIELVEFTGNTIRNTSRINDMVVFWSYRNMKNVVFTGNILDGIGSRGIHFYMGDEETHYVTESCVMKDNIWVRPRYNAASNSCLVPTCPEFEVEKWLSWSRCWVMDFRNVGDGSVYENWWIAKKNNASTENLTLLYLKLETADMTYRFTFEYISDNHPGTVCREVVNVRYSGGVMQYYKNSTGAWANVPLSSAHFFDLDKVGSTASNIFLRSISGGRSIYLMQGPGASTIMDRTKFKLKIEIMDNNE